tara:strand:+ start:459 stop:1379 length:921 start_codon:yes stop_codon:yes gene_type:complete
MNERIFIMPISNYPSGFTSGVTIKGIPVLNSYSGNVYWVDSNSSGTAGTFATPDQTLSAATNRCTANNGDLVLIKPGHAETVSSAGALDAFDVAGVTYIGLGSGTDQPTITLDTAVSADVDIGAANVTIDNVHFIANFADIAVMIDVNATDFTLRNSRFTQAGDNLNAKICIQDAAAAGSDRITVEGCKAIMYDAANTHFINFAGTGTGHIVRDNVLHGDFGTFAIGGAGVITFCEIARNVIGNIANTADGCINLASGATGVVVNNLCAGAAAQANGVTATACVIAENYYGVISEDLSGILDPIAT